MPATPFDTSGKSAALIQGADQLIRCEAIHFAPHLFARVKGVGGGPFGADSGLKSDIASHPKSAAMKRSHAPQQI